MLNNTHEINDFKNIGILYTAELYNPQVIFKLNGIDFDLKKSNEVFQKIENIIAKEVRFEGCKFICKNITMNIANDVIVSFKNCEFKNKIEIKESLFKGLFFEFCDNLNLTIVGSVFQGVNPLKVMGFKTGHSNFSISNCLFQAPLQFEDNDLIQSVIVEDSIFINDFSSGFSDIESSLFQIKKTNISELSIKNINEHKRSVFRKYLKGLKDKNLNFNSIRKINYSAIFEFKESEIHDFKLENICFTDIIIDNVNSRKIFSLNKVRGVIRKTGFFKVVFSDLRFEKNIFNSITIRNSDLKKTNIFYWDNNEIKERFLCDFVKWPLKVKHKKIKDVGNKNELFLNSRHSYRNLKNYMLSNNNSIDASELKGLELESFRKMLSPIRTFRNDFGNYLMLSLNRFTNNYGRSWLQPALIMLLGGIIPFSIIVLISTCSFSSVIENSNYYFAYLNPTHSFNFIKGIEFNFWSNFLDFLFGRIWNSYLIYQTIRGFRKYSSK